MDEPRRVLVRRGQAEGATGNVVDLPVRPRPAPQGSKGPGQPASPRQTSDRNLTPRQLEANALLGGPARHVLLYGGARSGKSYLCVRAILYRALRYPGTRHGIFRLRYSHVRASVWLDTFPKAWRAVAGTEAPPPVDHRQDGYALLPNGSEVWFGGLDEKERTEKVLGQEYSTILLEECSQIPYSSVSIVRTRLAQNAGARLRAYYTENPPTIGHWSYQEFLLGRQPGGTGKVKGHATAYAHLRMNPSDNLANLPQGYLDSLEALPERQRRRFLMGEFTDDAEGALWTLEMLDAARIEPDEVPALERVVVAVDPSGAKGPEDKRSDEIGIVAVGRGVDGRAYVLGDHSVRASAEGWAAAALEAHDRHRADCIVAEVNFGGDMVRAVLQARRAAVRVKVIHASRGKALRAEPVAALYEASQRKVSHAGRFERLEDQLLGFTTSGYVGERSPDRGDSLIHAVSELMVGPVADGRPAEVVTIEAESRGMFEAPSSGEVVVCG